MFVRYQIPQTKKLVDEEIIKMLETFYLCMIPIEIKLRENEKRPTEIQLKDILNCILLEEKW